MKIKTTQIAEKPKMIQSLPYSEIVSEDSGSTSENWLKNSVQL